MSEEAKGGVVLYRTEDGRAAIHLRAVDGTVWLPQAEIAALFDTSLQNVSLHLKNIFKDNELEEGSVLKESLITAADGKAYRTKLLQSRCHPRGRLSGARSARCAVPALGVDRAARVPGQGFLVERRAPQC